MKLCTEYRTPAGTVITCHRWVDSWQKGDPMRDFRLTCECGALTKGEASELTEAEMMRRRRWSVYDA